MDKKEIRQSKLDIHRLHNAADRIDKLSDAYSLAMNDIALARRGLRIIATWAACLRPDDAAHDAKDIHDRAMDTLSVMFHK